jgi:hypothetical protein
MTTRRCFRLLGTFVLPAVHGIREHFSQTAGQLRLLCREPWDDRRGSRADDDDSLPPDVSPDQSFPPFLVGQDPAGLHAELEAAIEATPLAAPTRFRVDRTQSGIKPGSTGTRVGLESVQFSVALEDGELSALSIDLCHYFGLLDLNKVGYEFIEEYDLTYGLAKPK